MFRYALGLSFARMLIPAALAFAFSSFWGMMNGPGSQLTVSIVGNNAALSAAIVALVLAALMLAAGMLWVVTPIPGLIIASQQAMLVLVYFYAYVQAGTAGFAAPIFFIPHLVAQLHWENLALLFVGPPIVVCLASIAYARMSGNQIKWASEPLHPLGGWK